MQKITGDTGVVDANLRENEFHPGLTAWNTRSASLTQMVGNVNGLIDANAVNHAATNLLDAQLTALENQPVVDFPGIWTTYGWRTIGSWTATSVVGQAKSRGFKWMVLQQEEMASTPKQQVIDSCHANGILCGVWEAAVDYGSPVRVAPGFDFWIGQIEGPGQYDRVLQSLPAFQLAFPNMPKACVTNFGGLSTADLAQPLIVAGLTCIVESHIKEDGVSPAQRVDYAVRVLGFPKVQAMIGLGNGATLADYPGIETYPGYSVFAAEELFT